MRRSTPHCSRMGYSMLMISFRHTTWNGGLEILPTAIVHLVLQYSAITVEGIHAGPFCKLQGRARGWYVILRRLEVSVPIIRVLSCETVP